MASPVQNPVKDLVDTGKNPRFDSYESFEGHVTSLDRSTGRLLSPDRPPSGHRPSDGRSLRSATASSWPSTGSSYDPTPEPHQERRGSTAHPPEGRERRGSTLQVNPDHRKLVPCFHCRWYTKQTMTKRESLSYTNALSMLQVKLDMPLSNIWKMME